MTSDLVTALENVQPMYEVPDEDLVNNVLIPAMEVTDEIDIAVGFFSSHCISQIAPGLASLIERDITCRLLVSPEISDEDRDAIARGLGEPDEIVSNFMIDLLGGADALTAHVTDCLTYLIARGTIDIRCVLMERGMFHKKIWIFRSGTETASVHGSGNMTARGLFVNGEQMTIDRPWMDGPSVVERVDRLTNSFQQEWTNEKAGRVTIEPRQMIDLLRGRHQNSSAVPTVDDFWSAWMEDHKAGLAPDLPPGVRNPPAAKRLQIPEWLDWTNPPYSHQESAVRALQERDYIALLQIATGGGKTKTSLIATSELQRQSDRSMLVVIVVPTRILAGQWSDEVRDFGIEPVVLSGMDKAQRAKTYVDLGVSLRSGEPRTEVVITTLALFIGSADVGDFLEDVADHTATVLIADEVHNFGAPGFLRDPPEYFQHRIGLSATPVRQYDADGTTELFDFFDAADGPAFSFSLGDAIKSGCLTPYRYHLHLVDMTGDEMELYRDLTDQLRRTGFGHDTGDDGGLTDKQERLLQRRRSVVEQASDKIRALGELLAPESQTLSHALIYCSAKALEQIHSERQIQQARDLLKELRISTHMYTAVESGKKASRAFLDGFATGEYQTLLAMKVLDEGVDIPAAHHAFLLASSTVEREWVQRRGRVLRKAPGKTAADLHDFIVVPPDLSTDPDGKSLIKSELRRAEHFTNDCMNEYDVGGPRDVIATIEQELWGG